MRAILGQMIRPAWLLTAGLLLGALAVLLVMAATAGNMRMGRVVVPSESNLWNGSVPAPHQMWQLNAP